MVSKFKLFLHPKNFSNKSLLGNNSPSSILISSASILKTSIRDSTNREWCQAAASKFRVQRQDVDTRHDPSSILVVPLSGNVNARLKIFPSLPSPEKISCQLCRFQVSLTEGGSLTTEESFSSVERNLCLGILLRHKSPF